MAYVIHYSAHAVRVLKKLENETRTRLQEAVAELAKDPFAMPNVKKLTGREGYRLRVGDWRILYSVHQKELVILVLDMGLRKEIYQ